MEVIASKLKRKISPIWQLIMGINLVFCSFMFVFTFIFMLSDGDISQSSDLAKAILIFGAVIAVCILAGIYMISRFITWRRLPEVVAEFDGHYLYIHGKKEIKIHVLELKNARVYQGAKHLSNDVFIWLKSKKRLCIPFTADSCGTRNKLERIIRSIRV